MAKPPAPKNQNTTPPPRVRPSVSIEREIDKQIGPLVNQGQRDQIVSRVNAIMMSEQFSGPIAHPKHLQAYEDILPGSADRIVCMAENEQTHNMAMEAQIVAGEIDDRKRGMRFGFAALIAIVFLGFIAGILGNNVLAGLLLGAGIVGLAGSFVKGRYQK